MADDARRELDQLAYEAMPGWMDSFAAREVAEGIIERLLENAETVLRALGMTSNGVPLNGMPPAWYLRLDEHKPHQHNHTTEGLPYHDKCSAILEAPTK